MCQQWMKRVFPVHRALIFEEGMLRHSRASGFGLPMPVAGPILKHERINPLPHALASPANTGAGDGDFGPDQWISAMAPAPSASITPGQREPACVATDCPRGDGDHAGSLPSPNTDGLREYRPARRRYPRAGRDTGTRSVAGGSRDRITRCRARVSAVPGTVPARR